MLRRCGWGFAVALWLTGGGPVCRSAEVADARRAVDRWVDVELTISKEALAWEEKKRLLRDLTGVAEAEIQWLKDELASTSTAVSTAEKRRKELLAQKDQDAVLASNVGTFLGPFEDRLRSLAERMPQPLRKKWDPLLARLPRAPERKTRGIAERMQAVMGLLTEIQRFDRTVITADELLERPDGETREINTIYFGLGAAYYVTPDGNEAGVGESTSGGWRWSAQPDLAADVQFAIKMARGVSGEAAFIGLPVSARANER